MPVLSKAAKLFVVGRLACFDKPKEVREALLAELDVEASVAQISAYDPTTTAGARMGEDLKGLFATTRKRFLRNIEEIPVANKAVRIRMLQKMIDDTGKNKVLAAQLLEQVAKESGDAYTNRHKIDHSGVVGNVPIEGPPKTSQTAADAYKAMLGIGGGKP
jgi:hypothetical protein